MDNFVIAPNITEKTILANLKIKPDVSRDELAFCAKCNEKGSYFVQTKNLKVKIKVDKTRKRAVILYYCDSWKNYLGNWEHDEVVSRDNDDVQRAWTKLMVDRIYIYKEKE